MAQREVATDRKGQLRSRNQNQEKLDPKKSSRTPHPFRRSTPPLSATVGIGDKPLWSSEGRKPYSFPLCSDFKSEARY